MKESKNILLLNEREIAEKILNILLKKDLMSTKEIQTICKENNVYYTIVMKFLESHTEKRNGFGSYDDLVLRGESANFVSKGCWSGEEKREEDRKMKEENRYKKTYKISIYSIILAGIAILVSIITFILSYFFR